MEKAEEGCTSVLTLIFCFWVANVLYDQCVDNISMFRSLGPHEVLHSIFLQNFISILDKDESSILSFTKK